MIEPDMHTISWKSPSNIALVKYWGKHGQQLPINPSLSITLRESTTTTEIRYSQNKSLGGFTLQFRFEGNPAPAFEDRIRKFLTAQIPRYPELNSFHLEIDSSNTFPHSSGIASSASAYSALALGIMSLVGKPKPERDREQFFKAASELARLGSGSASRSVYGGYVVWGAMDKYPSYSDQYAVPIQTKVHPVFQNMQDAILIVNAGTKKIGSSAGHALMNNHPYAQARVQQANAHMNELHSVLENGNFSRFIEVVENEALSLHGLMMSSQPGYFLMEQNTFNIIHEIRSFRESTKVPVCFTLDAGPNVHLLYPSGESKKVREWISENLVKYCHEHKWIDDGTGDGPVLLKS